MSTKNYLLTIQLLLLIPALGWSQLSFLDILPQHETWDNHAIAPTPDQGFVIGNDLKYTPEDWERHAFYLSKYDSCGRVEWAKAYGNPEVAYYFSDLVALSNGDAMAMGQTGIDDLFLMRIDPAGEVVNMFTFDTSNGDQNYNLDVQGNKIMVFGSFFPGNGARNFILIVGEDGQIDWAKSFHERLGPGAATYCSDGSIICVNGNLIYKVSENGNLEWSRQISSLTADGANLSRPVESGNGYVVGVRNPDQASHYLIKLNRSGQIQWQSDQVPSGFLASSVAQLSDSNLVMVNARPKVGEGLDGGAPYLVEFSPEGEIVGQYGFELDAFGRFTAPVCKAGLNRSVTIKGSFYDRDNYDYVIRLNPGRDMTCAGVEYEDVIAEKPVIEFQSANTSVNNLRFSSADTAQVDVMVLPFSVENYCQTNVDSGAMDYFDRLQCVDTLTFSSPLENATYLWDDGSTSGQRILKAPGQYQVNATTCRTEFDISIDLELGLCPCTYYIPNAFSPNGDGVNDLFETYATCAFKTYDLQIFNRWGELIHQSRNPDDGWDGRSRGKLVQQGMYMYSLKYTWEIKPGLIQDRMQTGSVAVVR